MSEIQQRTAEQLFRTLGELKGGAMKIGQMLSVLESAFPEEMAGPYREQLTKLQDAAPPMPTQTVRDILARDLGAGLARPAGLARRRPDRGRLDRPGAPGPLARRPRGRGQGAVPRRRRRAAAPTCASSPGWPGPPRRSCRASTSSRWSPSCRPGPPTSWTTSSRPTPSARSPTAFRDDPDIVVPDVVAVGDTVLVTEWLDSPASMASVIANGTQEERDHYGELFVRFLFSGPARTGMLHADPHPGNYRILPGPDGEPGRLGVLDFGAVARLPERGLPEAMGRLLRIAAEQDEDEPGRGAARRGLHQGPGPRRPGPGARLPGAVRGADQGRAVPVLPGVDAQPSSRASTTRATRRTRSA